MIIKKATSLHGIISVPGDKSISHRSIMFGAISNGTTKVTGFLQGADCLSTIACFRQLGVKIENHSDEILIHGRGLHGLKSSSAILDAGNSGTTVRLMSGILSAQSFTSTLTGDSSIQKRPMKRIITPLSQMGAQITSINQNDCAPLYIFGKALRGISYHSPVASAQVKSAILLAGLYADSPTTVTEPVLSRNHSELMLQGFGAHLTTSISHTDSSATITIQPTDELYAQNIQVPTDISSAAYFLGAGLIVPDSEVTLKNVGINPTRDGLIKVIQAMGGKIHIENIKECAGELSADITVQTSSLNATTISGKIIPTLIDEIPLIAVLACFAHGDTIIKDAAELKVKETNRIDTIAYNLRAMGANIDTTDDGMIIHGGHTLHPAHLNSFGDHRIAMAMAIAAIATEGECFIENTDCVNISYPEFWKTLKELEH